MVSDVEEVRQVKRLIDECRQELIAEGVAHQNFDLGVMAETPAAALAAPLLAAEVAFFSIGTNDLTQYVMAADRMNPRVSHLYRADHPAVLNAVRLICDAAREAGHLGRRLRRGRRQTRNDRQVRRAWCNGTQHESGLDSDGPENRERALTDETRLLVFDCDGVLVDSEVLAMRAYLDVLDDAGLKVPESAWEQCVGLKQADIFRLLEKTVGREIGPETRDRVWPRTQELFETELKATPGLVEFLQESRTARCVASSSSPERIRLSLQLAGLEPYFERVFSTQYVARGKPAPDIFLYAAEQMGVRPDEMVVIEDSAPGVEGATAAGAHVIGYLGGAHVSASHADRLSRAGARFLAKDWASVGDYLAKRG